MRITFIDYIANNNTAAAQALLQRWSMPQAKNIPQLVASLNAIISHGREQGYLEVAGLHPDKEMILQLFGTEKKSGADGGENKSSFCPCLGADGKSSFCGCNSADGSGCENKKKCSCKSCREKKSGYDGGYMDDWMGGGGGNIVTQNDLQDAVVKGVQAAMAANGNAANTTAAATVTAQGNHTLLIGGAVLLTLAVVLMRK